MRTILILEDDKALSVSWQDGFEQAGDRVLTANSATRALELLEENHVDLLISDIFIHHDGALTSDGGVKLIGLLRAAGARTERPELPVLAITGQPQDSKFVPPVLDLAKSLGADLCLEKPIEVADLVAKSHRLIRRMTTRGEGQTG